MLRWFKSARSLMLLVVMLVLQLLFFVGTVTYTFSEATLQEVQAGTAAPLEEDIFVLGEMFSALSMRLVYGMSLISATSVVITVAAFFLRKRVGLDGFLSILDSASYAGLCSLGAGVCGAIEHYPTGVFAGFSVLFWSLLFLPVFWVMGRNGWGGNRLSFTYRLWMAFNVLLGVTSILFPKMELHKVGHLSCFLLLFSFNLMSSIKDFRNIFHNRHRSVPAFIFLSKLSACIASFTGIVVWFTALYDPLAFIIKGSLLLSALMLCLHTIWNTLRSSAFYKTYDAMRRRDEENHLVTKHSSRYLIRYEHESRRMICRDETCQLLGLPHTLENMPEGFPTQDVISAKTRLNLQHFWQQMISGEETGSCSICYLHPESKENLWLRTDFITSFLEDGKPDYSVITFTIMKGVKNREEHYRSVLSELRTLKEKGAVIFEADLTENRFLSMQGEVFYGIPDALPKSMETFLSTLEEALLPEDEREPVRQLLNIPRLAEMYERGERTHALEFRRKTPGRLHWTSLDIFLLSDPYTSNLLSFFSLRDIETERKLREMGENRGHNDELTGLMGRTSFMENFDRLLQSARPNDNHVLFMVDLDGFKYVNDVYGHSFGDKVLKDVADSLRSLFRADDMLCRYGGDEFVLCMRYVQDDADFILQKGRSVCEALSRQFGDEVMMGACVGASVFPRNGTDFDTLFRRADQALYKAKNTGRNRCVLYDETCSKGNRIVMTAQDEPKDFAEEAKLLLVLDGGKVQRDILTDEYTLLEAADADSAMELLEKNPRCFAALVDMMNPALKGMDFISRVKGSSRGQHVQILGLGGWEKHGTEYASQAISLGADDVLSLPAADALLQLRVSNMIIRGESERLRSQNQSLLLQRATKARHQKQLQYLADHDGVTQIYNKGAFFRLTRSFLDEHADRQYAIVCFDIVRFRAVNDIFGYEAGDKLLRYIAEQLQQIVGDNGVCARISTDMFAMCIPAEDETLRGILKKLSAAVREYNFRFVVQLCYGVYVITNRELSINQMLDRASIAERSVKGSYVRNLAYYDDSMSMRLQEEQRMLSDMEQGLLNGEFVVYYQPKCRLDTGKVIGAEALVRWQHPQRGLLMPGSFVPIFEKNGFIMKLDEYIWEQVCIFLSKCRNLDPDLTPKISVNLSRVDLYNPLLCDTLENLCRKYNIPNEQMEVEITESAYVDNAHLLLDLAEKFHDRGFNVQMDDFGSGYSSLNMLNEIPVDVLKLDMRFLYRFTKEGRSTSILSSIVNMTKNLRISVIAEGVETEEQARFLAGIGCRQAQGFYYHKPLEPDVFLNLLQKEMHEESNIHDAESAKLFLSQLLTPAILISRKDDRFEMVACNDYYFSLVQINDANFSRSDKVLNQWVGKADEETLRVAMDEAKSNARPINCRYLQRDLAGQYHMLDCVVQHVNTDDDQSLYILILTEKFL